MSFCSLLNWEDQLGTTERVVRLLKPVGESLVLARQRESVISGEYESWKNFQKQATGSS